MAPSTSRARPVLQSSVARVAASPAPAPTPGSDPDVAGRTTGRRWWIGLALVTAAALALRLVYVLGWRADVDFGGDSQFYHDAANLLADGQGFVNPFFHTATFDAQSASHPPLYWLYLGLASWLGFTTTVGHMVWSTFIGAATVWTTGLAGRAIAGLRTGILAATIAAVHPNVWSWDGMILSETMALFAVTLTIWLAYRYFHSPTTVNAALMGIGVALSMLTRAELALLALFVAVPMAWRASGRRVGDALRRLVPAGIAALVLVTPWVAYNLSRFEEPVTLSTGFEITLLAANCDNATKGRFIGYWTQDCAQEVRATIPPGLDESEENTYFREAAFERIGDQLDRMPAVLAARLGRITHLFRPWQQSTLDWFPEGRPLGVARAGLYSYYLLAPAVIAGVWVLAGRRVPVVPVLAPIIVVLATTLVAFGQVRYRAPAETAMILLAAVTLDAVTDRVRVARP